MDIRKLLPDAAQPSPSTGIRGGSPGKVRTAEPSATRPTDEPPETGASPEAVRLEIRAWQEPEARTVQFARQALYALDRERQAHLRTIQARLQEGFYNRDDFIRQLAEELVQSSEKSRELETSGPADSELIVERLQGGYYDRIEVRRALAERILRQLRREPLE
jgi:hypothetical protein